MDDDISASLPTTQPSPMKQYAANIAAAMAPSLAIVLAAAVLVSCSPKWALIPPDPHNWDGLANDVKRLSPDESRLFAAYMSRQVMAGAYPDGRPNIPAGTTIGDAINEERALEAGLVKRPTPQPGPERSS